MPLPQSVLHTAARTILPKHQSGHLTSLFKMLQWLPQNKCHGPQAMAAMSSVMSSLPTPHVHSLWHSHWPQVCQTYLPPKASGLWSPLSTTCFPKRATQLTKGIQISAQILPLQAFPSHVSPTCNMVFIPFPEEFYYCLIIFTLHFWLCIYCCCAQLKCKTNKEWETCLAQ